jgi:TolA-binding protein
VNATHQYEKIYDAFIEGRFDEAIAQKKVADSLYGDKFWTPQLLYIESIYFIRSNQDPQARAVLQSIINKFPHTAMSDKAATMLDVLGRRRQIEDYLTRLQVTRAKDSDIVAPQIDTAAQGIANRRARLMRNDSNMLKLDSTSAWAKAKARELALARDTATAKPIVAPGDKLEANANNMKAITMDAQQLNSLRKQQDSLQAMMAKASADSQQVARLREKADSIRNAVNRLKSDTAQLGAKLRTMNSVFALNPDAPHSVLLIMNKVDPVYVSEARNAFDGYNKENLYGQQLTAENASLSDSVKILVIGSFATDKDALTYLTSAKALAPRQIVPWLPAGKYTFLIISGPNLQLLLNRKDLNAYLQFLSAAYPGKF